MALIDAARSGSRLTALVALRDRLADELDACESARDVAALSQRLMDVLEQVEALSAGSEQEGTALDEFTRRLQAKGVHAETQDRPRRATKSR